MLDVFSVVTLKMFSVARIFAFFLQVASILQSEVPGVLCNIGHLI